MKGGGQALIVVGALGLLVLAKFLRPESKQVGMVTLPAQVARQTRDLEVRVELSRAGVNSAMATLFDGKGAFLSRAVLPEGAGKLEISPKVAEILIEAAGHVSFRNEILEGGFLNVKLEIAGKDKEVFQATAPRPATEGESFCALRFSDAASGELLRGVRVYLDGAETGESSNDGEVSLPFTQVRSAKIFSAQFPGYKEIILNLNEAMVDELHVEPILMTRLPR